VPTGQAFFTGGSSSSSGTQAPLTVGQAKGPAVSSSVGVKKEINENDGIAEQERAAALHNRQLGGEGEPKSGRNIPSPEHEATRDLSAEWPPREFDSLEPVELPFGPRSLAQRVQLAQQTIFADSGDAAAMEREENESMLLLQLPSSIAQGSFVPPDGVHVAGGTEERKARRQLKPGKLGKIQITQSGRVYLVVSEEAHENDSNISDNRSKRGRRQGDIAGVDGTAPVGDEEQAASLVGGAPQVKRYEINRGITPSFMQVVASITTKAPATSGSDEASSSSNPSSSDSGDQLHLLGAVTDKIVVTPDFDIGQRTVSSTPSTALLECDDDKDGAAIMDIFEDEAAKTMTTIKSEVV